MNSRKDIAKKRSPIGALVIAVLIILPLPSLAGVGQSAVITLVFPYGARSGAMGEVGTALADDGSALFFNPAGLAVQNEHFEGGCGTWFYEPLLPMFGLHELWHTAYAAHAQIPPYPLLSPGAFVNYINMGTNYWTDRTGSLLDSGRSSETICALGAGLNLSSIGIINHHFGLTFKYIRSALAPGIAGPGTGIGRGIAVDLGYLWTFGAGFRLGATAMNMGPSISYTNPRVRDPLPFTLNLAIGYISEATVDGIRAFSLAGEYRLDREFAVHDSGRQPEPFYKALFTSFGDEPLSSELRQIEHHCGLEVTLVNTFSFRDGFLIDPSGELYEQTLGGGIRFLNHFALDYAIIYAPKGYMRSFSRLFDPKQSGASGVRHKQWRVSATLTRALFWSVSDLTWWKVRDDGRTPSGQHPERKSGRSGL